VRAEDINKHIIAVVYGGCHLICALQWMFFIWPTAVV